MKSLKKVSAIFFLTICTSLYIHSTEPLSQSYYYFQHTAEIKDNVLSLFCYSPDADDYVPYYSPMSIIERSEYNTIISDEYKGVMLQSDQLILVYINQTDSPAFRGCDFNSYGSSDWVDGIKEVFSRENLKIGEKKSLPKVFFAVNEIIFSSGVLDIDDYESYYAYARPRQIRITNHTTEDVVDAELMDTAHFQAIEFAEAGPYEISVEVLTVYPGLKSEEIAINYILFKGE